MQNAPPRATPKYDAPPAVFRAGIAKVLFMGGAFPRKGVKQTNSIPRELIRKKGETRHTRHPYENGVLR